MKQKHFCRCCLSEECYKDMQNVYYINNKTENYVDMLKNTFNITISNKDAERCFICEKCVSKLQDAVAFKEQVIKTQKAIKRRLTGMEIVNTDIIQPIIEDEFDDFDDHISQDFVWDSSEHSPLHGETYVIKLTNTKDKLPNPKDTSRNRNKEEKKSIEIKTRDLSKEKVQRISVITANPSKVKMSKRKILEHSHAQESAANARENTLKLIQNSNLCLFRSLQNKYGCSLCNTSYPEIKQLRDHYLTHCDLENLILKVQRLRGLSYKNADISNLKCNVCSQNCTDLTELMTHLYVEHDIFFQGNKHFLIPYKLLDGFKCILCELKFNSYLRLAMHMHTHYKNNVCETCGQSFINRLSLRTHVQSMHKEKKCSKCPAIFLTNSSKVKHLRKVHNIQNSKRYCNLCNKTFRYTYLLQQHKIQEHGLKRQVCNCVECGKSFMSATNLKIHIRSVHIKERNYPCTICGMRFFTKCDQKRHESTHQDVRLFACDFCGSKFKSKDSWRRHMKRQHGHDIKESS